ncbi:MAG: hypothetical protein ACXAC5_01090 [Promethearchaeota archaeon]|jgi:hypothetical protein
MKSKQPSPIIDSRHLKILAVKKDELKDCVLFVCLDEDKYGYYDVAQLRKLAEGLEKMEPSGCYVLGLKKLRFNIFDRAEIKNRDLIVTVSHEENSGVTESDVENRFKQAFGDARDIKFVHNYAEIE